MGAEALPLRRLSAPELAAERSAESLSGAVAASATTLESGSEPVTTKATPSGRRTACGFSPLLCMASPMNLESNQQNKAWLMQE
jgi:hypothetical protein